MLYFLVILGCMGETSLGPEVALFQEVFVDLIPNEGNVIDV